jgi:hypothetical protein
MEGGSPPDSQPGAGLPPDAQAVTPPPTDTMAALGGESSAQDVNVQASGNPEGGESESRGYELEHTQKSPLTGLETTLMPTSLRVLDVDPLHSEQAETVHGTSMQTTRPKSSVEAAVPQLILPDPSRGTSIDTREAPHATTDDASRSFPTAQPLVIVSPQPVHQIPVSKEPTTSAELQPEAPLDPRLYRPRRKSRLADDPRDGGLLATDIYGAASSSPIQRAASLVPPQPRAQSGVT